MKHLFWLILFLFGLWGETALSSYLQIAGFKINMVLILLIVVMLRWRPPMILFYGLIFGFMTDVHSHGILGVNGLSFFIILILAKWIGEWLYDENILTTFMSVSILSLVEGGIRLILLKILFTGMPWNLFFFKIILPLAPIHGVIAVIFSLIIVRLEKFFHLQTEEEHALYH